jgi:hypothetical protein
VVSTAAPNATLPAPASDPMDWLKLLRLSVARLATVNALLGAKTLVPPACSVPALTVVVPP